VTKAEQEHRLNFILDLGCGEGKWLIEHGGPNVIGVDINLNFLKEAKLKAKKGTAFVLCDGNHLPFKDKCFSMVHCFGVLHHMDNFESAINEIDRVLNGFLDIKEPVDNCPLFYIARRVAKSWRGMPIKSFFTSYALTREIAKKFVIDRVEVGGYTPLWFPFACPEFRIPTRFLKNIWNYMEKFYGTFLKKLGIDRKLATWVRIIAHNKKGKYP